MVKAKKHNSQRSSQPREPKEAKEPKEASEQAPPVLAQLKSDQEWAASAISQMILDPESKPVLIQHCGHIVTALFENLNQESLGALMNLTHEPAFCTEVLKQGGIEKLGGLATTLKTRLESEDDKDVLFGMVECILSVFLHLTDSQDALNMLTTDQVVVFLMTWFEESVPLNVFYTASQLLTSLAEDNPPMAKCVLDTGILDSLVAVFMNTSGRFTDTTGYAIRVLCASTLVQLSKHLECMSGLDEHVFKLIDLVLDTYSTNETFHLSMEHSLELLTNLLSDSDESEEWMEDDNEMETEMIEMMESVPFKHLDAIPLLFKKLFQVLMRPLSSNPHSKRIMNRAACCVNNILHLGSTQLLDNASDAKIIWNTLFQVSNGFDSLNSDDLDVMESLWNCCVSLLHFYAPCIKSDFPIVPLHQVRFQHLKKSIG